MKILKYNVNWLFLFINYQIIIYIYLKKKNNIII